MKRRNLKPSDAFAFAMMQLSATRAKNSTMLLLSVAAKGLAPQAALVLAPQARDVRPIMMTVESPARPDRNGRMAIAVLASAGAVETATITSDKLGLFGDRSGVVEKLCSSAGGGACGDVLNSPWADVGGVPLALFGAVAYSSITLFAAAPLLGVGPSSEAASSDEGDRMANALVFGSGALAAFSSCLLLLLAFVIQQPCALCFGSAVLSLSIFFVAWSTPLVPSKTESVVLTSSGALVSLAAAVALFFADGGPELTSRSSGGGAAAASAAAARVLGEISGEPQAPPTIRSASSVRALDIARRLQARGGQFYGAYWCSHCANQKEALGKEAMKLVPYNECDPEGVNSKRSECVAAGVKGYPTWSLDGKLYPGERDLDELEAMLKGEVASQDP